MENLFLKLVEMSVTASWITLAVILLRLPLRKAPKWVMSFLWALVALRLVCPFSFESELSLVPDSAVLHENTASEDAPAINHAEPAWESEPMSPPVVPDLPEVGHTVPAEPEPVEPTVSVYSQEQKTGQKPMYLRALTAVWLCGVGLMLSYTLVSYLLLLGKVRESVRLKGNVRLCDRIPSPFILGIISPKIYLPSSLAQEDAEYVLSHERAHLRRGDHLWKPFGFLLLTVYWFNPIMWLAYVLMCRDIELACDEKVIKTLGEDNKRSYSMALLRCSAPRRLISACPVAFGEVGVKERIKRVLSYKKPAFWVIMAALALTAVVAVCLMTNPVDKKAGITLPEEIQITEAGLHGNRVELHIREPLVKLTDEQIEELKGHLSGLKTGRCVTEGAVLYPCDIAVMTTARGVPSVKKNLFETVPHLYEIFYKSDGTVLLKPPGENYYEVDDKDFIEFIKSLKPETDEIWDDYEMTRIREVKEHEDIPVTFSGEIGLKSVSGRAARYSLVNADYEGVGTAEKLSSRTVTLSLGGVPAKVTVYRDKDGWLRNVKCDYNVVGFKAGDPESGEDDVIILSWWRAPGFSSYYVYRTSYNADGSEEESDLYVRSIVPDKALGTTRKELSNKMGALRWAENGAANPSCTKLAYISNKYIENGKYTYKTSVWIVDIATGCESRLELPAGTSIRTNTRVDWLDDDNVMFSADRGRYSVNVTTGEAQRVAYMTYTGTTYTGTENSRYMNGVELQFSGKTIVCLDVRSGKSVKFDIEKLDLYRPYWALLSSDTRYSQRFIVGFLSDGRYALFGLNNCPGFGVIDIEAEKMRYFDLQYAPAYLYGKENIILNSYISDGRLCGDGYSLDIAKLFERGTEQPPVDLFEKYNICKGHVELYAIDSDGTIGVSSGKTLNLSVKIPEGFRPEQYAGGFGASFIGIGDSAIDIGNYIYVHGRAFLTDELDARPQNYRRFFYSTDDISSDSDYYREVLEESFENDGVFRYFLRVHSKITPEYEKELNEELYEGADGTAQSYMKERDNFYCLIDVPVYDKNGRVISTCTLPVTGWEDKETVAELIEQMDIRLTWNKDVPLGGTSRVTDPVNLDPKYAEQYGLVKGFMEKIGFCCNYTLRHVDFTEYTSKYISNENFYKYLWKYFNYLWWRSQLYPELYGDYDITVTDMEVVEHKDCQTVTLRYIYSRKKSNSARNETYAYFVLANGENGLEIRDFVYNDNLPGREKAPPKDPDFWQNREKYKAVLDGLNYNLDRMTKALGRGPWDINDTSNPLPPPYTLNDCYEIDPQYSKQYELIKSFMTDIGFTVNSVKGKELDAEKYTSNEKLAEYLTDCFERARLLNELDPDRDNAEITVNGMEVEDFGDYQTVKLGFKCVWTYDDGTTGSRGDEVYFVTAQGKNGVEILDYVDDVKAAGRDRKIPADPSFWDSEEKYGEVLESIGEQVEELREKLNENG